MKVKIILILTLLITSCSIKQTQEFISLGVIQADNLTIDGKSEGYYPNTLVVVSCILTAKRPFNRSIINITAINLLYEDENPEDYKAGTILIRGTVDGKSGLWPKTNSKVIKYED